MSFPHPSSSRSSISQMTQESSSVPAHRTHSDDRSTNHLVDQQQQTTTTLSRPTSITSSKSSDDNEDNQTTVADETEAERKKAEKKDSRKKMITFMVMQIKAIALIILIDVGIPLALYYAIKDKVGYIVALVISGIPPLLHVFYKFWRQRKIDIIGCIFVVAFIGSAILSLITGNARIALFRDATVDILISLIFLVTLIPIHTKWLDVKPLCYLITDQMLSEAPPMEWITDDEENGEPGKRHSQKMTEWMWEQVTFFRRFCYILTFFWGAIMMVDFVIKAVIILGTDMTIDQIVVVNNVLQIVITVLMTSGSMAASALMHKRIYARVKEWKQTHTTPEQYEADKNNKNATTDGTNTATSPSTDIV